MSLTLTEKKELFKPLPEGRLQEIDKVVAAAYRALRTNPRVTVLDFAKALQPEVQELNLAAEVLHFI